MSLESKNEQNGDNCKGTLDIIFERDRSIGLGSTIGDGQTDRHTQTFFRKRIFLVSGIFPGKADSVILLGLEYRLLYTHKI